MKRVLLGTTALAMAAGMMAAEASAAEKIKLGLGGYFRAVIVGGDADTDATGAAATDFRSHGIGRESEIYFSGKTKLDNGIQFGVMVQLEGETSADQIDNSYIWSSGGFGRIEIGETWGPSLIMNYGSVGEMIDGHGDFASQQHPGNANGLGLNSYGGDAGVLARPVDKLNYYTPRLGGFQLGVSYMPDNKGAANATGGGLQTQLGGGVGNELLDIAANYTGKFGDVSIGVGGSFYTSDTESAAIGAAAASDREGWTVGGQFSIAGFTVGGRFKDQDQGGAAAGAFEAEQEQWRVGVSYSSGPWGIGAVYHEAEQSVTATTDDETTYISLGGTYALGPGIKMFGGVQFYDFDDATNARAAEADNTVFVLGTKFSF